MSVRSFFGFLFAILFAFTAQARRVNDDYFDCRYGDKGLRNARCADASGGRVYVTWMGEYVNPPHDTRSLYVDTSADGFTWGVDQAIDNEPSNGPEGGGVVASRIDPLKVLVYWNTLKKCRMDWSLDGAETWAYSAEPDFIVAGHGVIFNALATNDQDDVLAAYVAHDTLWTMWSSFDDLTVWSEPVARYATNTRIRELVAVGGEQSFEVVFLEDNDAGNRQALSMNVSPPQSLAVAANGNVVQVPIPVIRPITNDPDVDYLHADVANSDGMWWVALGDDWFDISVWSRPNTYTGNWQNNGIVPFARPLESPSIIARHIAGDEYEVHVGLISDRYTPDSKIHVYHATFDGVEMLWDGHDGLCHNTGGGVGNVALTWSDRAIGDYHALYHWWFSDRGELHDWTP